MTSPSFHDVEQISALLDGQLSQQETARLQLRIAADPELASVYQQLSQSRALLRKLPARRAPRNFTLTPSMAGVKAPTPRSFVLFRLASGFASLLLVLTFAANGLGQLAARPPATELAYGMGGGAMTENMEQPAPAEPRPQSGGGGETAIPALTAPSTTAEDSASPTEEASRSLVVEATQTGEELPAAKTGEQEFSRQAMPETPPTRTPFQVPGWLQLALLVVALLAGSAAWFVNWQVNARFARKNRK